MSAAGQYAYALQQYGDRTSMTVILVSGTDVMNIANRPLVWERDDDSPWSCRCESKMVLMTAHNLLRKGAIGCDVCVAPALGGMFTSRPCCDGTYTITLPAIGLSGQDGMVITPGCGIPESILTMTVRSDSAGFDTACGFTCSQSGSFGITIHDILSTTCTVIASPYGDDIGQTLTYSFDLVSVCGCPDTIYCPGGLKVQATLTVSDSHRILGSVVAVYKLPEFFACDDLPQTVPLTSVTNQSSAAIFATWPETLSIAL